MLIIAKTSAVRHLLQSKSDRLWAPSLPPSHDRGGQFNFDCVECSLIRVASAPRFVSGGHGLVCSEPSISCRKYVTGSFVHRTSFGRHRYGLLDMMMATARRAVSFETPGVRA